MKYALLENGQRSEAIPRGRASCRVCRTAVIAKCGSHRMHHWAHQGLKNCDPWKEHETQWHRDWKNKFPSEWQEHVQHDEFGEKHIADVRTGRGLVIEFQHSHLDPKERDARERFHKNIVWVVDGTRLKNDHPRFQRSASTFKPTNRQGHYLVPDPKKVFPSMWLDSPVPVFFDFLGTEALDHPDAIRDPLWQLLPHRVDRDALVVAMPRQFFVEAASRPAQPTPIPQATSGQVFPRVIGNVDALAVLLRLASQQPGRGPYQRRFRRF